MKKIYLFLFLSCAVILSGCGMVNNHAPIALVTGNQLHGYTSKLLSVAYPKNYNARESGDMLIVSSASGKIIIGGFTPAIGHPKTNEGDITFREITYTEDPKMNGDAIPAALYYRNGDVKTEAELLDILKTVKITQ